MYANLVDRSGLGIHWLKEIEGNAHRDRRRRIELVSNSYS